MKGKKHWVHLSKKQAAVINDMLKNGMSEYEAIEKNNVKRWYYIKWLASGCFRRELNARIEAALRQKLVAIINTEKGETARKACLDLISLLKADVNHKTVEDIESEEEPLDISADKAGRMLAILAEKEEKKI